MWRPHEKQFVTVKEQFGKSDGIQAYHGYLSFKEQDITPELAQKIGMGFANEVWGERFQVVVTTHLNTKHLHCHFVINSVSYVDGKRCQDTSWFKFRKGGGSDLRKVQAPCVIREPKRNLPVRPPDGNGQSGYAHKIQCGTRALLMKRLPKAPNRRANF